MLGAQRAPGAEGLERWGEACVGAGGPQGSGSGGKCDEGAGGLWGAWSRRNLGQSRQRGRSEGRIHGVEPA